MGQNVNAWHGEAPDGSTWGLGRLLRELAEIPNLLRLRYATSHPRDMDDDLIAAHRDLPTLMPFLHLPVQSGSDRILAAMNRKHTADDYRRIVDRLRDARPDLALSSDFIVGHPGETEADFEATMTLVRDVGVRPGLQLQIFAAARDPGRRRAGAGAGSRQGPPPAGAAGAAAGTAGSSSTRAASGWTCRCCSPAPAATLARSPDGHHFFNPFTCQEVLILLVPNRWCESSPIIQTHLAGTLVQERRIA